jgi:peptidoglycan hydrolase-like protein with peptidoglycan-binding domain
MSRRRSRAWRVALAVTAVLAVGLGVMAATGFDAGLWGGEQSAETGSDVPATTAKVTKQTLVDTQTESGELGHGNQVGVTGKLAGTLTALPAAGSTVERGQAICRVDDTPVVLLYGTLPAYRTLAPDTKGADVEQFENNLAALGYGGFTVDNKYTAITATAVKKWQKALGLPETGTVEPGRIYYAAGAVRVDSQVAAVGDNVAPDKPLLQYTGSMRLITVSLDVADQRLAVKGASVTVTLPDGKTVPGTITGSETVVTPASSSTPNSQPTTTIDVTVSVADQNALAGLDQASMRVAFTASQRENVLTVPVAALLALAEGGYGVEIVTGQTTKVVAVETGLFAAGRVEVSGEGLADGTTVGMPS